MAILATIGGTLLVVGVSLVIKSNWEQIGDWTKIGGLVALLCAAYTTGWKLKIAPGNYPKLGDACLMVGTVLFLLGIVLVSQIFHLNSRPPNAFLVWWVAIAALPWLTEARGMQCVSVVAWITWMVMELTSRDSWIRLLDGAATHSDAEFFVACAAAFLLGVAVLFFGSALRGTHHGAFAELHELLGVLLATATLYVLGFTWSAQGWWHHGLPPVRAPAVASLLALVAMAGGSACWRNRALGKALGWFLVPGFVPALGYLFGIRLHDSNWLWGGTACVAMFVLNMGMIRVGLTQGRESWINLGVAGIALNIVTRYFLLFGTMLEGGMFFITTGCLVLGLGWYLEHKRRRFVGTVRKEAAT